MAVFSGVVWSYVGRTGLVPVAKLSSRFARIASVCRLPVAFAETVSLIADSTMGCSVRMPD
jgi:hypothetical protein